ncbi:hypothetical protein RclHR1_00230026 [Rhizophagus clarus]|uniref:Protein kinase domain-containing protein n=1 Tax=Rhizophagus clarus TaxID=94130 RepID=A0A2Z6RPZ2_9GLOM|nr:hypothetical protein RclHR1_00230026 [Rhizophagus clarus]
MIITKIGKGGYGTIHKAQWLDGRIIGWDTKHNKWKRVAFNNKEKNSYFVALKTLHNSQNLSAELINELIGLQKCCGGTDFTGILRVYGVSQNTDTKEYILVLDYANNGDLRRFIRNNLAEFNWLLRIGTLYQIAVGLKQLHNKGLLHRDFHGGNIVCGGYYVLVTDLGLCQPVDKPMTNSKKGEVYGVLPYVAPEVLCGRPYSKASDVYSLGMLMYEIATGHLPFASEPHDIDLINKICSGARPKIPNNIPPFYTQLMQQCYSPMRPNADDVVQTINKWLNEPSPNINSELQEAEARRLTEETDEQVKKIHPQAIYTSRLLQTAELPSNNFSDFIIP